MAATRMATALDRGRRVADLLRRVQQPRAASIDAAELADVAGLLQDGGLSALIWNRLSPRARMTPVGREFRRGAMADAAAATRLDGRLVEILQALRADGVESLITKGWAVARYYSNPAARPYSDLDLAVRPDQATAARLTLKKLGARASVVDLHVGLADLPQRTWAEVFARSRIESLDGFPVRVLAPEDQFRLLTVHLVRHVCCRPLLLVDLAAMMERVGADMDWDLCLRGSYTWRRWTLAIAGLADKLLGSRAPESLSARPGFRPPEWLVEMTRWRWGGGDEVRGSRLLQEPAELLRALAYRQLNPIRWSYRLGLPPMKFLPPLWAASVLGKAAHLVVKLCRLRVRSRTGHDAFVVHSPRVF